MNRLHSILDHGDLPANLVDLQDHFGGIAIDRIGIHPAPGTATEEDLWKWKMCELVDGTIIVKSTSIYKGCGHRFASDMIRVPDLVFISLATWNENRCEDHEFIQIGPDLAIDFMTSENTQREMQRKRDEYIALGTKVIWTVDTVEKGVWEIIPKTNGTQSRWIGADSTLRNPQLLPGFEFDVGAWFAELDGRAR